LKNLCAYLFVFFFVTSTLAVAAQNNFPPDIKKALLSGNSQNLAHYFNQNVELMIKNKEDVYSKAQAEHIIKKFFSKNSPNDFIIESDAQSDGMRFAIGNLITSGGNYRVYLVYQKIKGNSIINRITISDYDN